ncbi:MAG: STAS domain-containing protein [Anaerolineae bacterium]|nr:STAS domain-containing protein [Anaerolineae bacterium]
MTRLISDNDTWMLKLIGDIDVRASKLLEFSQISQKLENVEASSLTIDLSEAEIIDSSGLRLLLEAKKELSRKNIEIILNNPSAHMCRLFRIMQLDQIFVIRGDLAWANFS